MTAKELGLSSIMICGPIHDDVATDMDIFDFYQEKLEEMEFARILNPMAIYYGEGRKVAEKPDGAVCSDYAWHDFQEFAPLVWNMPDCDSIYLMPEWSKDYRCWAIVSMAAMMKMPVIMHNDDGIVLITPAKEIINDAGEYDPNDACPCSSACSGLKDIPLEFEDVTEEELREKTNFLPGYVDEKDLEDGEWFEDQFNRDSN